MNKITKLNEINNRGIEMWRSKKGFKEFSRIIKELPSLINGFEKGRYDYARRRMNYFKLDRKTASLEIARIKMVIDDEEGQILALKRWYDENLRYNISETEFRETRKKLEYYDRLVKFNDS
tara:strand:- start:173 stop:535 length:363 start_codon:yes stop_codon:yes gene_type:complete